MLNAVKHERRKGKGNSYCHILPSMNEVNHRLIIEIYLGKRLSGDAFITAFMRQWKSNRDAQLPTSQQATSDARFGRRMGRLFTSCDGYAEHPEGPFEISESTLREEGAFFYHVMWE